MEYTIRQLAELSGVMTWPMLWYDTIGMLKPERVGEKDPYYASQQFERLTAYYDRECPGCAAFLHSAIVYWVPQN